MLLFKGVLRKHFPGAGEDVLLEQSQKIGRKYLLANRLQDVERSRKRPSADMAGLQKMLRHIQKAAARLEEKAIRTGKAPTGRSIAERLMSH